MNKYDALISELVHCYHIERDEPVIKGLQELVYRETPVKIEKVNNIVAGLYQCSKCKANVSNFVKRENYCPNCGQKLDWSEDND